MYVGPQKFVESDFVKRMRLKYSTTSEDGTVNLTPKGNVVFSSIGVALGTAASIALYVVVNKTILKDNNSAETTED